MLKRIKEDGIGGGSGFKSRNRDNYRSYKIGPTKVMESNFSLNKQSN